MRMRTLVCLILGLTAAALLGACAATGDAPIEAINPTGTEMVAASKTQPPQVYRFYVGDELSIRAVNRPELTIPARVDPYGYIAYPYLGQVYVKDLNSQEVAERLTRGLQEGGYYNRVQINVSLIAAKEQFVHILGEVKKPGPLPVAGNVSLLNAIGIAGGPTYDAEMSTVMFIRGSQSPPGVVKLDLSALGDPRSKNPNIPNFTLIPGDVIYVPDSVIASVQRFFNRMYDIIRTVVALESGVILYDNFERALTGRAPANSGGNTNTIIITPSK